MDPDSTFGVQMHGISRDTYPCMADDDQPTSFAATGDAMAALCTVEGLPVDARDALVLRLAYQHPWTEVARLLRVSDKTAKRRAHLGAELLAQRLAIPGLGERLSAMLEADWRYEDAMRDAWVAGTAPLPPDCDK